MSDKRRNESNQILRRRAQTTWLCLAFALCLAAVSAQSVAAQSCSPYIGGFYYPKGDLPKDLQDFSHLQIISGGQWHTVVSRAIVFDQKSMYYEFFNDAEEKPEYSGVRFTTQPAINKISYAVEGKFTDSCPAKFGKENPNETVLKGTLKKFVGEKETASAPVEFTYLNQPRGGKK